MSKSHWTINVSFGLRRKLEQEWTGYRIMKDLSPEEKEVRRQKLKDWKREAFAKIPKNNGREIYYRTKAQAEAEFAKAKLDPKVYEINEGFFLDLGIGF